MFAIFFSTHVVLLDYLLAQVSTDQRGRLMMTTERLNQSTDRIKQSRTTMLEAEDLGVSILQDLHQQRQSLLHAHTTVCIQS
jgi:vesicle transport through interaction with t-SNAREs protein 1